MVVRVQTEDFDIGAEFVALTAGRTDIGGIGCFVGTVRADPKGDAGQVTGMTLEHYPGMTEQAIERIVADARGRWPLLGVTVIHRVGPMRPGENIVLVIAASSHRQAALDATAFLIDWLKTKAPFWKREDLTSGAGAWVDARDSDDTAAARWDRVRLSV
ncbi:MAG TPA: molybdenum cofactor biosynthesis protein MoaE [Rhodopila sp.]|uniref:molybdenum cofactor biosynthesis protein MoaE n=1 Tax=Rhodopila sp. TaxID=2480087 RepID=UPI002CA02BF0|nr:molybdenum cofactor biosynthesis protein MoaE [Rhodopila sp.]HVY14739.1 molybdenum cofactor biosynthesis protein MoaE [Rhodopila sp.]